MKWKINKKKIYKCTKICQWAVIVAVEETQLFMYKTNNIKMDIFNPQILIMEWKQEVWETIIIIYMLITLMMLQGMIVLADK